MKRPSPDAFPPPPPTKVDDLLNRTIHAWRHVTPRYRYAKCGAQASNLGHKVNEPVNCPNCMENA